MLLLFRGGPEPGSLCRCLVLLLGVMMVMCKSGACVMMATLASTRLSPSSCYGAIHSSMGVEAFVRWMIESLEDLAPRNGLILVGSLM